jgi:hypothetical protein
VGSGDGGRIIPSGAFYYERISITPWAPRSRRGGMAPIGPLLRQASARIGDANTLATGSSVAHRIRADVDVPQTPGAMQTREAVRPSGVDANFDQPTRTAAILLQGGTALVRDREATTSTPRAKMTSIRDAKSRARRTHAGAGRSVGTRRPNALAPCVACGDDSSAASALEPQEDSLGARPRGTITGRGARLLYPHEAPGLQWDEFFRAARLRRRRHASRRGSRARSSRHLGASWSASERSRRMARTLLLTLHAVMLRAAGCRPPSTVKSSTSSVAP